MMRFYLMILFFIGHAFSSCTDNFEPLRKVDIKRYNDEISKGILTNAEWVKTPEAIARRLFPQDAHQEGNNSYIVQENRQSETSRKVTVTELGAFDDEVSGEIAIIDFIFKKNNWEIISISKALKRRY